MRTPNLGTAAYAPGDPGGITSVPELARFTQTELQKLAAVVALLADGHLDALHSAPAKPRDGDIRYADGSDWNPGSGRGIYAYNGTAWVLIVSL